MNNWLFNYPLFLFLVPLLYYCLYRCKHIIKQQFFPHLTFFSTPKKGVNVERLLKMIAVGFVVLALATPTVIDYSDPKNRNGIDIVLSLDGSGSMNASGFSNENQRLSRFESVQKIVQEFIKKRHQDNIGIVMFGDFAFIATPITYEKEIIAEMVGYLNYGMAGQNTAIGEGIAQSVFALRDSKARSKVIILLTDGENNSGAISPKEATQLAKKSGIKLYTIGIGDQKEFDSKVLETIASEGQGAFFTAKNESELQAVYLEIDNLERSKIKSEKHQFYEHFYQWFLAAALIIVLWIMWKGRIKYDFSNA